MAVSLTHTTVAVGVDAGNGEIRKAQWNENHTLTLDSDKLLGRASIGTGAVEEIDCTAAGRALLDDATAAAQCTTLGLGTGNSPTFTGLTLSGVATFSAGTALLPSLTTSGDTNTGMWFPAADTIAWSTGGSERMRLRSDGNFAIGSVGFANSSLTVNKALTGGTDVYALRFAGTIQSDVTSSATAIFTNLSTADVAFSTTIYHFFAFQNTFGASSTVTSQFGYYSAGGLIGATNNYGFLAENTAGVTAGKTAYGFRSNINIATGGGTTWAFYGNGTAPSYFNGNVGIGTTSFGTSAAKVFALGNATAPSSGPADTIQIYSSDLSAGNTMLSLWTEGTVVNANVTAATTHRIAIRVNGTVYYLLANTSA